MKSLTSSCCGQDDFSETEFQQVQVSKANGIIPVTKYVSKSTGLVIYHAETEGPIVNGYIGVATRPEDDLGLPHIVEHMIFFGSEDYPYAGALDKISNKCLSSGTHAWTEADHTCYALSTAGAEGFCQLLPVYFDHVFFPLLSDATFKTEVHHVTAKGGDGGIIYWEMHAQEYNGFCKATHELHKTLFPSYSGYHWNVGGGLKNLRENCTNEKVKEFHKKYYHPRNACLIVCGDISPTEIFRSIRRPILKLRQRFQKEQHSDDDEPRSCGKPWAVETLDESSEKTSIEKTIHVPCSEEEYDDLCVAVIGFLGPSCVCASDLEEACGLLLVLKYLTTAPSSPLKQEVVENQLATSLEFFVHEFSRSTVYFELEGIKSTNTNKVVPSMRNCLEHHLQKFDMQSMQDVIKGSIQHELSTIEKTPHDVIADTLMKEFIYCNIDEHGRTSTFGKRLDGVQMLENFMQKPADYWIAAIRQHILERHWVAIFVKPSEGLHLKLENELEERMTTRKLSIGGDGLMKCALDLDAALLINAKPVPKKIIRKFKAPSIKSIHYHKVESVMNPTWIFKNDFPSNICVDDIKTNFVYALVVMDTTELDDCFREYLPLFKESIFKFPLLSDDGKQVIPHDIAAAARFRDLLMCQMNIGLELWDLTAEEQPVPKLPIGSFSHLLTLLVQVEIGKVEIGFEWIRKIIWKTKWSIERIQMAASILHGEVLLMRQEGLHMCQVILRNLIYDKSSNTVQCDVMNQTKLLNNLGSGDFQKLKTSENEIRTAFDSILNVISDANNVSLHLAADMKKLRSTLDNLKCGNLVNLLKTSFPFEACSKGGCHPSMQRRLANSFDTKWMLSPEKLSKSANRHHIIYGLFSSDSNYMTMVGPGLTSYEHADVPALLTVLQYLNQVDGPIHCRHCKVRGCGFGYSYSAALRVNEGLIYFNLSRCPDLLQAYESLFTVIAEQLSTSVSEWSSELMISAKNALIFDLLETERTPLCLACHSALSYYRKVPVTYVRTLITKISKVTTKDLKRALQSYVAPLFEIPSRNYATVIVCPLDQVDALRDGFERFGKPMRAFISYDELMKGLCDGQ